MTDDRSRANRSPVTLAIGHRSSVKPQVNGVRLPDRSRRKRPRTTVCRASPTLAALVGWDSRIGVLVAHTREVIVGHSPIESPDWSPNHSPTPIPARDTSDSAPHHQPNAADPPTRMHSTTSPVLIGQV